jgi:hypothetical protein
MVNRPVRLGVEPHLRPEYSITIGHLRVSYYGEPSLTRGLVCNLLIQLLLGLAKAVTIASKSRRTHDHILLSQLSFPQPGGPDPRIHVPQEQGGPVIPPGIRFPLRRPLRLAGLR